MIHTRYRACVGLQIVGNGWIKQAASGDHVIEYYGHGEQPTIAKPKKKFKKKSINEDNDTYRNRISKPKITENDERILINEHKYRRGW